MRHINVVSLLLSFLSVLGCAHTAREPVEWARASTLATYDAYVEFQKRFPESKLLAEADQNAIRAYLVTVARERAAAVGTTVLQSTGEELKVQGTIQLKDFSIGGSCTMVISVDKPMTYDSIPKLLFTTDMTAVFLAGEAAIYSTEAPETIGGVILRAKHLGVGQAPGKEFSGSGVPLFWQGLSHKLIGHLVLAPWEFYSDPTDPLVFNAEAWTIWKGTTGTHPALYSYKRGRGIAVGEGKVYLIGLSQ